MKQIDEKTVQNVIAYLVNSIPVSVSVGAVNGVIQHLQNLKDVPEKKKKK